MSNSKIKKVIAFNLIVVTFILILGLTYKYKEYIFENKGTDTPKGTYKGKIIINEEDDKITSYLKAKSCNLPFSKHNVFKEESKLGSIYNTKSYHVTKSKFGGIVDIRPRKSLKEIYKAYPELLELVDTVENTDLNQGNNKYAVGLFKSIFYDIPNDILKYNIPTLSIMVNLDNDKKVLERIYHSTNSLNKRGYDNFNSERKYTGENDINIIDLSNHKRILVFLSIFSGDNGHATSFIIDNNLGFHFDSNRFTFDLHSIEYMYDIIIEDLNLDGIYSIAELNKNCSFTLRYQSEPSTCLTWTYMFLLLCFLNKDKTIQEIADYWGWKIGKYKGEGNIEEYLNDKVKSFSIFMLEYSKYEGDYDENGWQEYVYSLVSTADGDVYSEITIPINVYLSYNKKFKYDFYSEWSSNTNKIAC